MINFQIVLVSVAAVLAVVHLLRGTWLINIAVFLVAIAVLLNLIK